MNWSVTDRLWNLWRRCLYGVYVRMPSIWMFWLCFDKVLEEHSCNICFIDECRGHLYHQVGLRLHYQFYLDTAKKKSKQSPMLRHVHFFTNNALIRQCSFVLMFNDMSSGDLLSYKRRVYVFHSLADFFIYLKSWQLVHCTKYVCYLILFSSSTIELLFWETFGYSGV